MADTVNISRDESEEYNVAGWALAIIAIAILVFAAFYWVREGSLPGTPNTGTDVNITAPGAGTGTGTGGATY